MVFTAMLTKQSECARASSANAGLVSVKDSVEKAFVGLPVSST